MDTMKVQQNKELAERVGFEPTLEFPLNTLSKRAPSATRPSLRGFGKLDSAASRSLLLDSMVLNRRSQPRRIGRTKKVSAG
jgi:hypothetical protein